MSEVVKPPAQPKPPSASTKPVAVYYEKYFDPNYKAHYYYNPADGSSVWEVPEGSIIADMTIQQPNVVPQQQNAGEQKTNNKKVDKKKLEEEKRREEYRKKQAAIEQLQQENLMAMYPEQYQQKLAQNHQQQQQAVEQQGENQQENQIKEYIQQEEDEANKQEEEEERERKLFRLFRNQQVQEFMKRAARRQLKESKKETAYIEGNYDYNIWYDKYLTDRTQQVEKAPSLFKCNPEIDTGYTKADKFEKKGSTYFCVYFARGACTEGVNCRFYHRVPQEEDLEKAHEDNLRDVFGRARHATHKEDHTGIGSFNKECRTLLVTDIQLPTDSLTPVRDMVRIIYEFFSPWGEIEDIHFNSQKCQAYIKYSHRYFAEFAREAMMDQVLMEGSTEPIAIKWALDSPFDKSESIRAQQEIKQQQEQQNLARVSLQSKNKKAQYLQTTKEEADPHKQLPMAERVNMRPEDLVPQLANQSYKKREKKIMDKDRKKEQQMDEQYKISRGFDEGLFQEKESGAYYQQYHEGQVTDVNKVIENCNKMNSVLQMIEKNYGNQQ